MLLMCVVFLLDIALVSSTDGSCREGWYGVDCGLQCSDACRPLEIYPCDKETGKCSQGCKLGFYGPQCEKNCSCFGHCIQDTGDCIGDPSTSIPTSQSTPLQQQDVDVPNTWMIVAVVFIVLFSLMVCLLVLCIFLKRRNSQRGPQEGKHVEEFALMCPKRDKESETKKHHRNKNKSEDEQKIKKTTRQLTETKIKMQKLEKKFEAEKESHMKLITEHNTILERLGLHRDSSYYLLEEKDLKRSAFLQCIWLELDPQKVNVAAASLDEYGMLSNKPHPSDSQREGGLKNYSGTTTTAPLQLTGSKQYWEVENNIAFNKTIPENETLLDLGFCSAEDQDKERFTPERKPFCSLRVINCSTHKQICLTVLSDKKHACYYTGKEVDVDDGNVPTISLKLGVLMHENGKKISFFDVNNHKNIQTASLELKEEIWPMFGLGAEGRTGMNLTLICGNAIDMTNEKIALIKEASC